MRFFIGAIEAITGFGFILGNSLGGHINNGPAFVGGGLMVLFGALTFAASLLDEGDGRL